MVRPLLLIALASTVFSSLVATQEVRTINPPKLDLIGKKILCHRPMRRGTPKMSVEALGEKVVAHCYGHGGSGLTLAPGATNYVIDQFEKFSETKELNKESAITIIGAGIIGYFTAYNLIKRGYTNISLVADRFDNLPSYNCGGLIAPVSMDNDPEMQKVVDQIGIDAYILYKAVAENKVPEIQGAIIVPTYFQNREDSGLEPYVGTVMQPAKDVLLNFGNGTTREMVSYDDGIFVDPATMMKSLAGFLRNKIKISQKHVNSFEEINSSFIFNCTGIGSRELTNDDELVSVQGHLIMLKDQNPADLQHMILVYFNEGKTASGLKIKRSFYIFPKKLDSYMGVVGGTFIEGGTADIPNEEEYDIMIQGAKKFYGIQ